MGAVIALSMTDARKWPGGEKAIYLSDEIINNWDGAVHCRIRDNSSQPESHSYQTSK